ncbi:hypothetical protein ACHAWF_003636 [Thalassiosira exigua]
MYARGYPGNEVRVVRRGDDSRRRWFGYYVVNAHETPRPIALAGVSDGLWTRFRGRWPAHDFNSVDDPYYQKLYCFSYFQWTVVLVLLSATGINNRNKDSFAYEPWFISLFAAITASSIYVTWAVMQQIRREYRNLLEIHVESFSGDFLAEGYYLDYGCDQSNCSFIGAYARFRNLDYTDFDHANVTKGWSLDWCPPEE